MSESHRLRGRGGEGGGGERRGPPPGARPSSVRPSVHPQPSLTPAGLWLGVPHLLHDPHLRLPAPTLARAALRACVPDSKLPARSGPTLALWSPAGSSGPPGSFSGRPSPWGSASRPKGAHQASQTASGTGGPLPERSKTPDCAPGRPLRSLIPRPSSRGPGIPNPTSTRSQPPLRLHRALPAPPHPLPRGGHPPPLGPRSPRPERRGPASTKA